MTAGPEALLPSFDDALHPQLPCLRSARAGLVPAFATINRHRSRASGAPEAATPRHQRSRQSCLSYATASAGRSRSPRQCCARSRFCPFRLPHSRSQRKYRRWSSTRQSHARNRNLAPVRRAPKRRARDPLRKLTRLPRPASDFPRHRPPQRSHAIRLQPQACGRAIQRRW